MRFASNPFVNSKLGVTFILKNLESNTLRRNAILQSSINYLDKDLITNEIEVKLVQKMVMYKVDISPKLKLVEAKLTL